MTVVWSFPTRILFGTEGLDELGSEALALGAKVALVVTDEGVRDAGLVQPCVDALGSHGIETVVFDQLQSNPLETEVLAATDAYRKAEANIVVAIGGGSAIDVAKLVRLAATHPLPLSQYDEAIGGAAKITETLPPMLAVPTAAGSGSEVSPDAIIKVQATGKKTVIRSRKLVPSTAILDPRMSASAPRRLTAAAGMNALTQCIEAYLCPADHPMADAIALEGVALLGAHLEAAANDGQDLEARGLLLKASTMGAVAREKGQGACQSLAQALSSAANVHHGVANALCLPAVLDFNRGTAPERIAKIAKLLGARGDDVETLAFECSGAVRALSKKLGLPEGLGALNLEEEGLPKLAKLAMEDACHRGNPRTCTAEDFLSLYRASL